MEAHHRSLHSQSLGGGLEVSYGDSPIGSSLSAERRLDGLYRSERRLPSGSDSSGGRAWQFRVLCFGLSTAPQVFTRVMALVSGFLHRLGVLMFRYLDDWLIMASSQEEACWARDKVPQLCQELGIVVNLDKSSLTPSHVIVYLGIKIELQTFRTLPTPSRIEKFFSIVEEFLSSKVQSTKFCRVLLGHLASLIHIVPGGQLRMRAPQLALKRGWNFVDDSVLVPWDAPSRDDLLWRVVSRR